MKLSCFRRQRIILHTQAENSHRPPTTDQTKEQNKKREEKKITRLCSNCTWCCWFFLWGWNASEFNGFFSLFKCIFGPIFGTHVKRQPQWKQLLSKQINKQTSERKKNTGNECVCEQERKMAKKKRINYCHVISQVSCNVLAQHLMHWGSLMIMVVWNILWSIRFDLITIFSCKLIMTAVH